MHRSFGMETLPPSNLWTIVRQGPSIEDVRRHLLKITKYRDLFLTRGTT
jgi:hypothetical protein